MKMYSTYFLISIIFTTSIFANESLDTQSEIHKKDVKEDGLQFVQNWEDISNSIMKEIENINLMNESNFAQNCM